MESWQVLYTSELIRARGSWQTVDAVELATWASVASGTPSGLIGHAARPPPAEFEAAYRSRQGTFLRTAVRTSAPAVSAPFQRKVQAECFAIQAAPPFADRSLETVLVRRPQPHRLDSVHETRREPRLRPAQTVK